MKLAYGKEIPNSTEELVDPKHTALLIVDVQNDYAKRYDRILFPKAVRNLLKLLEAARKSGLLIVYIQDTLLRERLSDSPAWIRHTMLGQSKKDPGQVSANAVDGSQGHRIINEIQPKPGDVIIKKFRSSAFVGTSLDLILRSNSIRNVIVTGISTEACVESTCRDASNEYVVVVAEDCVDSDRKELHNACMRIMKCRYDVLKNSRIIAAWRKTHSRNSNSRRRMNRVMGSD